MALMACNLKLFTSINVSDILSEEHKVVMADLKVNDIALCRYQSIQKISEISISYI